MEQTRIVETHDQAVRRLAEVAEERGIRIYCYPLTGEHYATSASSSGMLHRVTLVSCDCAGFFRHGRCTHHSALLAHLEQLPPMPPAPTQAEQTTRRLSRVVTHQVDRHRGAVTPEHAENILGYARQWLASLIEREEAGETVPEADKLEATQAVALYSSIANAAPVQAFAAD